MADFQISAESFRKQMAIPKELQKAYDAGVRNGLLVLFSRGAREEAITMLERSDDVAQALADGVFSTVVLLHKQSNGTMPPEIMIPVGMELIGHCFDVGQQAGVNIDQNDVAEAMGRFVEAMLKAAGVDPQKMQQMVSGMDSGMSAPGV